MTYPTIYQQTASSIQMMVNSSPRSKDWSKDWELDLNPTKSEHLPIGTSSHFVTYTLPSSNPPNTHNLRTVSTTKGLGFVFNTRLGAEDNVANAANKARVMLFLLETILSGPYPQYFSPPV